MHDKIRHIILVFLIYMGLRRWLSCKEFAHNVEYPDQFMGQEEPLEKGMATHSSILA